MKVLHERSKQQEMKISVEKVTKATFKFRNNICIKQPENECLEIWKSSRLNKYTVFPVHCIETWCVGWITHACIYDIGLHASRRFNTGNIRDVIPVKTNAGLPGNILVWVVSTPQRDDVDGCIYK